MKLKATQVEEKPTKIVQDARRRSSHSDDEKVAEAESLKSSLDANILEPAQVSEPSIMSDPAILEPTPDETLNLLKEVESQIISPVVVQQHPSQEISANKVENPKPSENQPANDSLVQDFILSDEFDKSDNPELTSDAPSDIRLKYRQDSDFSMASLTSDGAEIKGSALDVLSQYEKLFGEVLEDNASPSKK